MDIERAPAAQPQRRFSRLEKHEPMAFDAAAEVTELQLKLAIEIVKRILPDSYGHSDGVLIGSVVNALANNFAAITISRSGVGD